MKTWVEWMLILMVVVATVTCFVTGFVLYRDYQHASQPHVINEGH